MSVSNRASSIGDSCSTDVPNAPIVSETADFAAVFHSLPSIDNDAELDTFIQQTAHTAVSKMMQLLEPDPLASMAVPGLHAAQLPVQAVPMTDPVMNAMVSLQQHSPNHMQQEQQLGHALSYPVLPETAAAAAAAAGCQSSSTPGTLAWTLAGRGPPFSTSSSQHMQRVMPSSCFPAADMQIVHSTMLHPYLDQAPPPLAMAASPALPDVLSRAGSADSSSSHFSQGGAGSSAAMCAVCDNVMQQAAHIAKQLQERPIGKEAAALKEDISMLLGRVVSCTAADAAQGRMYCCWSEQLPASMQQGEVCFSRPKARSAAKGRQRAEAGTPFARNFNFGANTPLLLSCSSELHTLLHGSTPPPPAAAAAAAVEQRSTDLYSICSMHTASGLMCFAVASESTGQSAAGDDQLWDMAPVTINKRSSKLYKKQVYLLHAAFVCCIGAGGTKRKEQQDDRECSAKQRQRQQVLA
jgi:hypothetical protein